ncbi:MAG: glycosyltransferase [Deltaproteobacteria bacterium]|nr:glycosyltransferase [Deltaproteobacteria bacterium]
MGTMIEKYRNIAPDKILSEINALAGALKGRTLQHISSTRIGGGVAEILNRMIPWTVSLGIPTTWNVIDGRQEFFEVTKSIHNALQGSDVEISCCNKEIYLSHLGRNAGRIEPGADVVMVHDPQPAFLIEYFPHRRKSMVWRCHIDLSQPMPAIWRFLRPAINKYAMAVFHIPHFAQKDLTIPKVLISPSIDPLSEKNRDLAQEEITDVVESFGIDRNRPIIVQVSRFDRFKDPMGVVAAFRQVRRHFDCQLVLAGGGATDDPEGPAVQAEVEEVAAGDPDILVLFQPTDLEVNALQRAADIIVQKSTREGFGLTVTEGMWKGKPVIGGAVGGIPAQIIHGETGYLVNSPEGAAYRIRYLLGHPRVGSVMGAKGREHVRYNFLITRHVRDYLLLMLHMMHNESERPVFIKGITGKRGRPEGNDTAAEAGKEP